MEINLLHGDNLERDLNIIIEKIEDGEFQFKDIESQEVKGILDYFKILTMGTENYNVENYPIQFPIRRDMRAKI